MIGRVFTDSYFLYLWSLVFVFSSLHHRNIIFFAPVGKVCVSVCKRILKEERGNSNSSDTIFTIYQVTEVNSH